MSEERAIEPSLSVASMNDDSSPIDDLFRDYYGSSMRALRASMDRNIISAMVMSQPSPRAQMSVNRAGEIRYSQPNSNERIDTMEVDYDSETLDLETVDLEPMKSFFKTRSGHVLRYLGKDPALIHRNNRAYHQFVIHKQPADIDNSINHLIVRLYPHGHLSQAKDMDGFDRDDNDEYDEVDVDSAPYERNRMDVIRELKPWTPQLGDVVKCINYIKHEPDGMTHLGQGLFEYIIESTSADGLDGGTIVYKLRCTDDDDRFLATRDNLKFVRRP